ncbi:acylphosphatase [Qipengyuania mesophila]|uniref:acylphosphatase n=1 Tax=Qipengyuania mesophila TaxID=2867246 RepID=UPI003516A98B
MTARHCIVHGRVQGVFYRDWTVAKADELGLAGWVRNRPDGTVEALLEGDADTIARMVAAMHEGPPRAAPTRIDQREVEPQGLDGFTRR